MKLPRKYAYICVCSMHETNIFIIYTILFISAVSVRIGLINIHIFAHIHTNIRKYYISLLLTKFFIN